MLYQFVFGAKKKFTVVIIFILYTHNECQYNLSKGKMLTNGYLIKKLM